MVLFRRAIATIRRAKIMNRIDSELNLPYKDFSMPSTIERKTICTETGLLAIPGECPSLTEYFAPGTAPTETCGGHYVEPEPEEEPNDTDDNNHSGSNNSNDNNNNSGTTAPTTPTEPTTPSEPSTDPDTE